MSGIQNADVNIDTNTELFIEKLRSTADSELALIKEQLFEWINGESKQAVENTARLNEATLKTQEVLDKLCQTDAGELNLYKIELDRATKEIRRLQAQYEDITSLIDPLEDNMPAKFWKRWYLSIRRTVDEVSEWVDDVEAKEFPKEIKSAVRKIKEISYIMSEFTDNIGVHAEELELRHKTKLLERSYH